MGSAGAKQMPADQPWPAGMHGTVPAQKARSSAELCPALLSASSIGALRSFQHKMLAHTSLSNCIYGSHLSRNPCHNTNLAPPLPPKCCGAGHCIWRARGQHSGRALWLQGIPGQPAALCLLRYACCALLLAFGLNTFQVILPLACSRLLPRLIGLLAAPPLMPFTWLLPCIATYRGRPPTVQSRNKTQKDSDPKPGG